MTEIQATKVQEWRALTGLKINHLAEVGSFGDHLWIRKLHQIPLPVGMTEPISNELIDLMKWRMIHTMQVPEVCQPMGAQFLSAVQQYFKYTEYPSWIFTRLWMSIKFLSF